jgi:hypothetical protein
MPRHRFITVRRLTAPPRLGIVHHPEAPPGIDREGICVVLTHGDSLAPCEGWGRKLGLLVPKATKELLRELDVLNGLRNRLDEAVESWDPVNGVEMASEDDKALTRRLLAQTEHCFEIPDAYKAPMSKKVRQEGNLDTLSLDLGRQIVLLTSAVEVWDGPELAD